MRLGINTMKFSGNLTELKKFLEKETTKSFKPQVKSQKTIGELIKETKGLAEELSKKDKEDEKAMREYMFQGDNQSFSG